MIELALIILGGIVFLVILQVIGKQLWLTFKWRVLGWKPRILDEKLVTETVEDTAAHLSVVHLAQLKELGLDLTQKDQEFYRDRMKQTMRSVIEMYIDRFTRRC
jgi:hypothetical protein